MIFMRIFFQLNRAPVVHTFPFSTFFLVSDHLQPAAARPRPHRGPLPVDAHRAQVGDGAAIQVGAAHLRDCTRPIRRLRL